MHPLINVQLARAVRDDSRRRARRQRGMRRGESRPVPRLRAPWPPGWSPEQAAPDRFV